MRAVHDHRVELADGNLLVLPGAAAVAREIDAAVVAEQPVIGILGIDPHGVVVDVHARQRIGRERLAAVFALEHRREQQEDVIRVGGIEDDFVVVVVRHGLQVVDLGPRGAGVARAEHAAPAAL